jgi:hypothetical protein
MRLYFAGHGKWTSKVAQLAHRCGPVRAYIEGPYGAPMIDTFGARYTAFLIVTSGLGWTFLRAWKRQLVQVRTCPAPSRFLPPRLIWSLTAAARRALLYELRIGVLHF